MLKAMNDASNVQLAKMKEEAKSLREDFLYMDVVHDVP
jgi:hypothetical protein